ncbi:MAG: site-2 protease family protein [Anaerolineae bacterium]
MRWSIKLGRVFGIDLYIHATFLLLLAFLGYSTYLRDRSVVSALEGVAFFVLLFGCVVLHECGHALAARRYGIPTRDITLYPIGGVARLERMPSEPRQELFVAVAGPLVNVVIALVLFGWLRVSGNWAPLATLGTAEGPLVERLALVNASLVVFNMIPAFPMDGGRVLRALLAMRLPYARATRIAAALGQGIALLFGLLGLFGNPILLFIALFVWIAAGQESGAVQVQAALDHMPVERAMMTRFDVVAPDAPLRHVVDLILSGSQVDFPVVLDGRLVGLALRSDVFAALRGDAADSAVADIMRRDILVVDAGAPLTDAVERMQATAPRPVQRQGQLVGLTLENLGEFGDPGRLARPTRRPVVPVSPGCAAQPAASGAPSASRAPTIHSARRARSGLEGPDHRVRLGAIRGPRRDPYVHAAQVRREADPHGKPPGGTAATTSAIAASSANSPSPAQCSVHEDPLGQSEPAPQQGHDCVLQEMAHLARHARQADDDRAVDVDGEGRRGTDRVR